MLYLLEDNRIVNSEYIARHYEEGGHLKRLNYFEEVVIDMGKIKKQSENVIDLIEVGDLLKIEYEGRMELCDFQDNEFNYASYLKDYYPNRILAIYKPNENGDYIKVWEKKDDEFM